MNRMTEIEIDKYDDKGPHKAGSTLFLVQVKETLIHHYLVSGEGVPKTKKQLLEDYKEGDGTYSAGWSKKDGWTDFDNERISSIEKVTYSPCTLALRYLTPPQAWLDKDHPKYQQTRYLSSSTAFDVQPEGSNSPFSSNRIYRKYARCTNYVNGSKSLMCDTCEKRILAGWSIITPLKEMVE